MKSEAPLDILVVGDVITDVIVRPEGPLVPGSDRSAAIRTAPGGSGANQAAWLGHLGVRVGLAGRVGGADAGYQSALLRAHGVTPLLAADPDLPTGMIVTLLAPDGERSFLTDRGANIGLRREDLPDALLGRIRILHVSGYTLFTPGPRAAVQDLMAAARARGVTVTVDAASAGFLRESGPGAFLAWTGHADICFADADEAAALAGTEDSAAQLASLAGRYPTCVIKRGADGAEAACGEVRVSVPAEQTIVVDTTGAGDAFLAGFLTAKLRGEDLRACLSAGTRCGAQAVTTLGGRPARVRATA
jgi:sugar/nucleoside kinase (ribokinase family)